jgi:hypothetical protein
MSKKPLIVWAEDEKRYVKDIVDELKFLGADIWSIGTCNDLLRELDRVINSASLFILDLWLPVGTPSKKIAVPQHLASPSHNTERAVWMLNTLQERLRDNLLETPILVLSGNLDIDTIALLEEAGIPESRRWKKPATFDKFIACVVELAKLDHNEPQI